MLRTLRSLFLLLIVSCFWASISFAESLNQSALDEQNSELGGPTGRALCYVACYKEFPEEGNLQWICLRSCEVGETMACELLFARCKGLRYKHMIEACMAAYDAYCAGNVAEQNSF